MPEAKAIAMDVKAGDDPIVVEDAKQHVAKLKALQQMRKTAVKAKMPSVVWKVDQEVRRINKGYSSKDKKANAEDRDWSNAESKST